MEIAAKLLRFIESFPPRLRSLSTMLKSFLFAASGGIEVSYR